MRRFYHHLFTLDPATRPLFRESLKSQGRALVKMLSAVVQVRRGYHVIRSSVPKWPNARSSWKKGTLIP
jgi:hypothetical protein